MVMPSFVLPTREIENRCVVIFVKYAVMSITIRDFAH